MHAVALALVISVAAIGGSPAIENAGFEAAPFLRGWTSDAHPERDQGSPPTFTADQSDFREGSQSLLVEARDPAEARLRQKIYLPVGSLWRVTAWLKTQDLKASDPGGGGAFIEVESPPGNIGVSGSSSGSTLWHLAQTLFRVPSPGWIYLTLVATHRASGKVWFDDVRLEPLEASRREDVRIFRTRLTRNPVDRKQQGQFIELLCNLIPSIIAQQVVSTSFEEEPPCHVTYKKETDEPHRPWYPHGAVEVAEYSFDGTRPYNGARSQKIRIPVARARAGISQDGFYLKRGVGYTLRLHMRGEGDVQLRASLHGGGRLLAEPVLLGRPGPDWTAAEAILRATETAENATLTLDFEGPGTVWLDRVYLIGSDAVLGLWRPDVVAALAAMHPGVIRFGGSTIEGYEWQRGVGPWDEREPFTTVWGGLEENFVGIDDFIQLCRHVGAEPLLCVRWTDKKPEDAAAEVEYCNGGAETRWGGLRAKNGHPEPYHVKYFQIGNEVDAPEYYSTVRAFADAMKEADPSIKLLSSFPNQMLLDSAGTAFDYLCPHHYEVGDLVREDRDFKRLEDWIAREGGAKNIRIAVTEWNTTAGDFGLSRGMLQTLGNTLSASRYLNLLQRHADGVEIANRSNFADSFGSGFLITGPGWIYESPTYYAQKLYARAAGTYPVRVERSSQLAWQLQEPDVGATLSPDGKKLRVYAVNSTLEPISLHFELRGFTVPVQSGAEFRLEDREHALTAEVMNSRDEPERVSLVTRALGLKGKEFEFIFRPLTVTLLELRLGSRR